MRRIALVLLILLRVSAAGVQAQAIHRGELTLDAGTLFHVPDAFVGCHSSTGLSFGIRGGYRLSQRFLIEASLENFGGLGSRDCLAILPNPPPLNGTQTTSYIPSRFEGYPLVQTGLRMAWIPIRRSGQEFRFNLGIERAWQHGLWIPTVGVSRVAGRGPIQLLLDAGVARYVVPLVHLSTTFVQGQETSSSNFTEHVSKVSPWLRIGMVIHSH